MSFSDKEALSIPEAVIASRSGSSAMTALKLPLVPSAHPRRSRRRPASTSCLAKDVAEPEGLSMCVGKSNLRRLHLLGTCLAQRLVPRPKGLDHGLVPSLRSV